MQWPPAITIGCSGRAVLAAHRHAREIEALEQVRVDELGREVEGEHVEVAGGAVGVDARTAARRAARIDAAMSIQGA